METEKGLFGTMVVLSGGQKHFTCDTRLPCIEFRLVEKGILLTHDHTQAASPAFCQPYAHSLEFRGEIFQEFVRRGMKAQCWRNEIYQRGQLLQFHSWKVPVAAKISVLLVLADLQPVIRACTGR